MTRLEEQIKELSPSVKDALYRRLLFAEDLAWLRDEKKKGKVIGFEVDLEGQELSGFALIAIQRHTVIAFVSDRDEQPRLILFPALEILFDPGFELLDLIVTRKEFKDSSFEGISDGHGRFGDMVKDMTPPNRRMDIPDTVVAQMAENITREEQIKEQTEAEEKPVISSAPTVPKPQQTSPFSVSEPEPDDVEYDEGPPEDYDEPDNFDSYEEPGSYDDYDDGYYDEESESESEPEPAKEMTRSERLKAQTFNSLSDITDYVVGYLHIDRSLAVTLVNKAMQSKVSPEYRVQLAVNIFCKLMDEGKI